MNETKRLNRIAARRGPVHMNLTPVAAAVRLLCTQLAMGRILMS